MRSYRLSHNCSHMNYAIKPAQHSGEDSPIFKAFKNLVANSIGERENGKLLTL